MGIVGIFEDVHRAAFPDFRQEGRALLLLRATEPGDITDVESEFGSSEYAKEVLGSVWGYPPELELEREAALQKAIVEIINSGLAESVHDCSEGGIAVNLAESAMARGVGARVDLSSQGLPAEFVLFGEDASRIVISCDRDSVSGIQQVAVKYGLSSDVIGETASQTLEIAVDGKVVVSAPVAELRDEYENALERALKTDPELVGAD